MPRFRSSPRRMLPHITNCHRRHRFPCAVVPLFLTALFTLTVRAGDFAGEWRTSFGIVMVKAEGNHVTGSYGDAGQFTLDGTVEGDKLSFDYTEGQARGSGRWTLDKSG